MEKLEIYDEDTLNEFELKRQNNIIRNYEFMRACGKNVMFLHIGPPTDYIDQYRLVDPCRLIPVDPG